ncbi:MAG: thioredoxin family protein [Sedimentisphaerales bacterium]
MKNLSKIIIVLLLAASVTAVVVLKKKENQSQQSQTVVNNSQTAAIQTQLPRLVDLGADKCIPCKMMAPILEELRKDYDGTINVEFIDVWKAPERAKEYGITIIPTQIFFDASGKELFRHEGFFSKEDILAKWMEFGVELAKIK